MKRAVVVGTGAGGATAARALQGAFDVTVLEAGEEFRPFARDLDRLVRLRATRLFLDPRLIRLLFPPMHITMVSDGVALVRGIATGGTTTLATGNALRVDTGLRELGIDLDDEFRELEAELPISIAHRVRWRTATKQLFAACSDMKLEPVVTPKLVDCERCQRCGRCVLGCPRDAKWDSRRFLDEALAKGARLQTGVHVERVVIDEASSGARVTGVATRHRGRRAFVPADLVVLAAGGLGTPVILERSGIATENRLFVDPVLCVAVPWQGAGQDEEMPMPFVVERDHYIVSPYFDYLSYFFDRRWLRPGGDILALMVKLADTELGVAGPRGVRKGLTAQDKRRLREAVELCTDILVRAGAPRESVFLGTPNAGHPGGMLPVDGEGREPFHDDRLPPNLYVADASLFPRSLGKPPMLTIMAMAGRVAQLCTERHG
jgi:choline dehydrogenase-like flavoprotein